MPANVVDVGTTANSVVDAVILAGTTDTSFRCRTTGDDDPVTNSLVNDGKLLDVAVPLSGHQKLESQTTPGLRVPAEIG